MDSFREKFERGELDLAPGSSEKPSIDSRYAELGFIKNRFEQGGPEQDKDDNKCYNVEEEFKRFKSERQRMMEQHESTDELQANQPSYNPDDIRQSVELGSIKKRFEEGTAYKSAEETERKEFDDKLEIKVAGKAREKFRQIDKETPEPPLPGSATAKLTESKWAKDENGPRPEPVNRRVDADNEETETNIRPEDFEVKNLLSKFKNLETTRDEASDLNNSAPKPKRAITPPPSGYQAEIESQAAELDPNVVRSTQANESLLDTSITGPDAQSLRARFEAGDDVPGESADEKRRRLEEEFQMFKTMKQQQAVEQGDDVEQLDTSGVDKEDLGISAEHASKMKAKWEKINRKEAKKAEKSAVTPKRGSGFGGANSASAN